MLRVVNELVGMQHLHIECCFSTTTSRRDTESRMNGLDGMDGITALDGIKALAT